MLHFEQGDFKPVVIPAKELRQVRSFPELRRVVRKAGLFLSRRDPGAPKPYRDAKKISLCFRTERNKAGDLICVNYWRDDDAGTNSIGNRTF